jgi:hypothetical protein
MIHLCINASIATPDERYQRVRSRFDAAGEIKKPICMSVIVFHELMHKAANSKKHIQNWEKRA